QWDKEYFHCGYYDFFEAPGWGVLEPGKRGGGFIILASEDGTNVTVNLNGLTKGVSKTTGEHDIGDSWSFSLNAGQTYMVRGKGETKGLYDITGTKIRANKPIGVISTHVRTMIPSICPEDRDHISEMIPPTSTLGKEYVTVQFNRKAVSPRTGKGDLFRVVAIQDNTKITCSYFDSSTGKLVGNQDTPLAKAGMFADVMPILDINNANTKNSIYGVAHWQSDKPFLLVQYAFSNRWDGDNKWAPKSIVVAPMEQYTKNAVFQVPVESDFNDNTLTILAKGDPSDPEYKLLKSVAIDGNEIHKLDSKLFANRISGTDIYWTRIPVSEGAHYITSNTLVTGYVTGFSSQ
ncbi:MAG: IgGFc-binding protein, partial [Ignavibacteria bacterium]|nr:IgGFc-binding protein [Ignavibacteria bacterium]